MPFLFLRDGSPLRHIRRPYVTYGLILANVAIFAVMSVLPGQFDGWAYVPNGASLLDDPVTLVTYQFMHGSMLHLLGNMLMLFIFGDNIEDSMGHLRYLLFYLLTGIFSALAFGLSEAVQAGPPIAVIGASGSIGGLLAAYLLLHPRARVLVLVAFRFPVFAPAGIFIAIYVALDFLMAFSGDHGIAWWAHIGGFLSGLLLVRPFKFRDVPLFAPATHYPEAPFPELEREADGRLRRLLPFGKIGERKPLSRRAAIIVAMIKVVSYLSLLLYLMLVLEII